MTEHDKTCKYVVFIIFILSFTSFLYPQWAQVWGGSEDDQLFSIRELKNGDFISAGYTNSYGDGDEDALVIKITKAGKILWRRIYGGSKPDVARRIRQTKDGGFIVAGYTNSFGAGDYDMWVFKLKANGKIKWQKTYGGSGEDAAYSVVETIDGNFVIAGHEKSAHYNVWIIKVKKTNGNIIWEKKYDASVDTHSYSIQQTKDGGFIVAGVYKEDIWIMKLDSEGEVAWKYKYVKDGLQIAFEIHETSDGNFILAAILKEDIWIAKLKSDGRFIWQKYYIGSDYDYAFSVYPTSDDGFIIAGTSASFGKKNMTQTDNCDLLIVKINSMGNIEWQKIYGGEYSWDIPRSIQETSSGGYIVAGLTESWGAGKMDTWILKLSSSGGINSLCTFISDSALKTKNGKVRKKPQKVTISETRATAEKTKCIQKKVKGKIYSLGKKIMHKLKITKTENGRVDPPPGTYAYSNGEQVTIKAFPDQDYSMKWAGHIIGEGGPNPITFRLDGDKSVQAVFYDPGDWSGGGGGGIGSIKISESRDSLVVVLTGLGLLLVFMTTIFFLSVRQKKAEPSLLFS